MTPRKKWPEAAEWARVDSIAALDRAVRTVQDAAECDSQLDMLRKMVGLVSNLRQVQVWLREAKDAEIESAADGAIHGAHAINK